MNERIKQLAEKSGAKVHREQTRNGDWVDFSDYTGFDYEKFAELIVAECIKIALDHDPLYGASIDEDIKRLLGVK